MTCDRCGKDSNISMVSMFNREEICMECKKIEVERPDYETARKADEDAIRRGDFNFKGIGF